MAAGSVRDNPDILNGYKTGAQGYDRASRDCGDMNTLILQWLKQIALTETASAGRWALLGQGPGWLGSTAEQPVDAERRCEGATSQS